MKVNPKSLRTEFKALFDAQASIEKDKNIDAKKRKYEHLELESKYNTNTLSEIFQDPDLLARISEESYSLMNTRGVRPSRVRDPSDIITFRKPQAKDVTSARVVEQEVATMYDNVEKSLNHDQEYINPLAPKLRKYIAQEENNEATSTSSQPQTPALSFPEPININMDVLENVHAKDELNRILDETSKLIRQSPLKTVQSNNLCTLLPRQADINAFIYVKEDYNDTPSKHKSTVDDTLITITIFNPKNPHAKFQEVEMLGSQTLSSLRDAIYCQSDFTLNRNHKNQDPNEKIVNTTKTKLSPSVIYMNHVFYIDTRCKDDIPVDYYDTWIDSWLAKKQVNRLVHKYQTESMERAIIQDVTLELHKPFAFVHQDSCEHMMLIDDIRLISSSEYGSKSQFPRTTRNLRYDRFKCSMCSVYPATKITHEDIVSGFSPCYFCDICFESFHHGDLNVKVTEYRGAPCRETKSAKSSKSHKHGY
ncbi:snRNA-activating protein of 50kDa MW C terminal-domain-containing protein [Parasitella parasitica]|nr:snRNA-activating protein of 50kDa MW C terminal-domain-containing protein [Parasitella parasitica]